MTKEYDPLTMKCSKDAFEFKSLMEAQLERYLENNPQENRKSVAAKLEDASQSDLSHWLSTQMRCTMSAHLVKGFCGIVGDNSLIWHIQEKFEAAS